MKKYLAIILLSSAFNVSAQVPGYLGKKFFLGGGTGLTPCLYQKDKLGISISPSLNGSAEIVLNRKTSLMFNVELGFPKFGFAYSYLNGGVMGLDPNDIYHVRPANYKNAQSVGMIDGKTFQAGGVLKFFRGRFIAPVGRYTILGLGLTRFGMKESSIDIEYDEFYPFPYEVKKTLKPKALYSQLIHFTFGFGKGTAINKHLMIDTQIVSNLALNGEDYNKYATYRTVDEYIYGNIWRDLKWREAIQFNIILKYAIF